MFDFEKLIVYSHAKKFNLSVTEFIKTASINRITKDQLYRASLSIMLNIAEGSGRFSKADKKRFYVVARGSAFECLAIFDSLKDKAEIEVALFEDFYKKLEEISKMLFSLIRQLDSKSARP